MRILQICQKLPFPPTDGGAQATYFTTIGLLANNADVTVIAINPSRIRVDTDSIPTTLSKKTNLITVDVDTRINPIKAFLNIFKSESYFTERFHSGTFKNRLIQLLQEQKFDIVQFEHIYMCIYLDVVRKHSSAKVTLRPQNIEHIIWQRYMAGVSNPLKQIFLKYSVKRLKQFEEKTAGLVDAIIPLTEEDARIFREFAPGKIVITIPMGYDLEKLENYNFNRQYEGEPVFYHLASMDWLPNEEAMKWFMKNVASEIIAMHPKIRIHIAGRKMQGYFFSKSDNNVIVESEITDPVRWQEDKAIMIVPLLSGSGIRAKIIEGLALGKTIITTSIGAQGIVFTPEVNLLIADTPEEFARQMSRCYVSKDLCRAVGREAKKLSSEYYEYKSCSKKMIEMYQGLLSEKS